ncbi:hypothetical protein P4647_00285 [Peribacillus frigoritolerans]|nr:hypothetical protein [Peribacillus frigoritolerans]
MNPVKQAFSPFGMISIVINVSCSISMMKYSPRVTREVRISFDIFESISNMGRTDITDIVDKGKLLRVAECSVENVKRDRFEQVLKDAGNRGMIPGMLSGAFGKRQNGRYMAASLWDNEDSHQRYADKELPALIKESGVKDSTQRISVSLIELHPKWMFI